MFLVASVPALSGWDAVLRLAIAALLGAAIGAEREVRDREAGIRTHLLVSLGSALFTIVSAYGFHEFLTNGGNVVRADPTRIAAYRMMERFRPEENRLIIELSSGSALKPLLEHFDDVRHVEVEDERDRRVVTLEADGIDEAAVAALTELEYVIGVSWRR